MRLLGVSLFAALALASPAFAYHHYARLDAMVTTLAGRPAEAHCPTTPEWREDGHTDTWAFVYLGDDFTTVDPWLCWQVVRYLGRDPTVKFEDVAFGILVLTHESFHIRNAGWKSGDEAQTECWAIRHVRVAARLLGLDEAQAKAVLYFALRSDALLRRRVPRYDLPSCVRPLRS